MLDVMTLVFLTRPGTPVPMVTLCFDLGPASHSSCEDARCDHDAGRLDMAFHRSIASARPSQAIPAARRTLRHRQRKREVGRHRGKSIATMSTCPESREAWRQSCHTLHQGSNAYRLESLTTCRELHNVKGRSFRNMEESWKNFRGMY